MMASANGDGRALRLNKRNTSEKAVYPAIRRGTFRVPSSPLELDPPG